MQTAARIVVLTGAGVSAESGVPVFRGAGGMWRDVRPEDLATPEAFRRQPELVWEWYLWRRARIADAAPNPAHHAIARWQRTRGGVTLLTQNVDGLHARAGSHDAIELHGNVWRVRCADGCGASAHDAEHDPPRTSLRCRCGGWLRPDVVWFGEPLDAARLDAAIAAMRRCDVALVVGTSAIVYPVAALPHLAKAHRVRVVEVNTEETPLTAVADAVLRGPAGDVLPALEGGS